jgi:hypothetical protein
MEVSDIDDRDIWEGLGRRLDAVGRMTKVPALGRANRVRGAGVRWRRREPSRWPSRVGGIAPVAVVAVVIGLVSGWALLRGANEQGTTSPGGPVAGPQRSQTSAGAPAGCGPSDLGALKDEGYTRFGEGFGRNEPNLGVAGNVLSSVAEATPTRYTVLLPKTLPGNRPLGLILWQPGAEQLGLIYSSEPVSIETTNSALHKSGGMALTQRPFNGQDAEFVLENALRNKWLVEVGPHPAALVWGSEVAAGVRPFGLYWADGVREWILIGNPERPEDLVDFARSIYC